jgi:hypothetical protein
MHVRQLANIDHVDIPAIRLWFSSLLNSCELERGTGWVDCAGCSVQKVALRLRVAFRSAESLRRVAFRSAESLRSSSPRAARE